MERFRLKVQSLSAETPAIKSMVLSSEGSAPLRWEAGAHIRIALPGGGDRPYSLMALPGLGARDLALGVLLEEKSSGGSRFMHSLKVGDMITASAPVNNFGLHEGDAPALLFAGGIGITPILSMAAELKKRGLPFGVHYAGRTRSGLAFVSRMREICGDVLSLHYDDDESRLDIGAALDRVAADAHLYVCGPSGMIDAVKANAAEQGFSAERIHSELFKSDADAFANTAFEVEVHSTGQVVTVGAGQTIIEALEEAGLDPLYDCRRGDCGICQCGVISGIPDHRDVILTDEEKASNKVMQICVSRARSARLVLDLRS